MKIALTGASGHIGANLCRTLLEQNHELRILSNKFTDSLEGLELQRVQGNLMDVSSLLELADAADVFIHLAAIISINGSQLVMDTNAIGTNNVLKAVKESKVKRLIHFSSIHALVHEPLDQPLDETRPLALHDHIIYNRSKAMAEQSVLDAVAGGLDAVIINPTSVIGPNDFKPSLVGEAILQLYKGQIPALIPGGYDWVDVRDVVSGTITAIEKGRTGESYLLSGQYASLADMYKMLLEIKGGGKKLRIMPFWLAGFGVPFLRIWAGITGTKPLYTRESIEILKTSHMDIRSDKAEKELDYHSRPFKETLEATLSWFGENHYL